MRTSLPVLLAMLLAGTLAYGPIASAAAPLPPNLQALPASNVQLTTTTTGARLLRFTTVTANVGAGPLELRAGEVSSDGTTQKVYQRVYDSGGGYQDYLAGDFIYHAAHNHIHFENYALYELQPIDAPGASKLTGSKVSFCVLDSTRINTKLSGAPRQPAYATCGYQVQGLSVGWGDKYAYYLAGQSFDVTGLPDGIYVLRITVDPKNLLKETDDEDNINNISELKIKLVGAKVIVCGGKQDPCN
jgi:lysyl oxidase